ncbi:MAG: hypothetical protein GOMPHAMPRED_000403 [Gomphillus americanus]|uniref:WD40 repeat-like protein n=1 Tax=Gomphillus americanus TaxID=1940652 RepID=A0A8H3EDE2_9LECA|nr:MAG: hypothetical protein GOMPHAMPRED_000403 [Gomphillus americanus]
MPSYSSKQFLEEYELELEKEFEYNGITASWAPNPNDGSDGGPRFWDDEDEIIPAVARIPRKGFSRGTITQALSSDEAFLAVATDTCIRIYRVESLSMTDELTVGHDEAHYVRGSVFTAKKSYSIDKEKSQEYVLISYSSSFGGGPGTIHIWNLDAQGCLRHDLRAPDFPADNVAKNALKAIENDLSQYGISTEQVNKIQDGFLDILAAAHTTHAISKIKTIQDAQFTGFNSSILSHACDQFLYEDHGQTTQHGMRPEAELPQIVIMNLKSFHEICRLKGHTDVIMWSGWSLDDEVVATASWDATFRIWNARTGVCKHIIGPTGGQNWAGQFLPDGKHLLLSGGRPHPLALYDIETGQKIRSFDPTDTKLDHWLRYFTVHPQQHEDLVIVQNGMTLLAWQPLHPENQIQELFALKPGDNTMRNGFARTVDFGWSDRAQDIFIAKNTDGSAFVWDKARALKWRFQRQKARSVSGQGSAWLVRRKDADWIASLDGDGAVRFWKL